MNIDPLDLLAAVLSAALIITAIVYVPPAIDWLIARLPRR